MRLTTIKRTGALVLLSAGLLAGCGSGGEEVLTVYSGRSDTLVGPLLDRFHQETGINIDVRYGSTSGTVALLLEEGDASPADVAFLQDAGALGALEKEGMLQTLPDDILNRVDARFRSRDGQWVGTSGRARTVIYNVYAIDPEVDLPESVFEFTDPKWRRRVGWAPPNGSFQAFVTAMRVVHGDEVTRKWLTDMVANEVVEFPNNVTIVDAAARGEIDVGLVNHYYLYQFIQDHGSGFAARNHYYTNGNVGGLINAAGVGILETSDADDAAQRFVEYLLSAEAQGFFAQETTEYPLIDGVEPVGELPAISELNPPDVDLSNLDDLRGTLDMMREVGVLP